MVQFRVATCWTVRVSPALTATVFVVSEQARLLEAAQATLQVSDVTAPFCKVSRVPDPTVVVRYRTVRFLTQSQVRLNMVLTKVWLETEPEP
jgi:hypothetical protein